jgi:hypothetical protein
MEEGRHGQWASLRGGVEHGSLDRGWWPTNGLHAWFVRRQTNLAHRFLVRPRNRPSTLHHRPTCTLKNTALPHLSPEEPVELAASPTWSLESLAILHRSPQNPSADASTHYWGILRPSDRSPPFSHSQPYSSSELFLHARTRLNQCPPHVNSPFRF